MQPSTPRGHIAGRITRVVALTCLLAPALVASAVSNTRAAEALVAIPNSVPSIAASLAVRTPAAAAVSAPQTVLVGLQLRNAALAGQLAQSFNNSRKSPALSDATIKALFSPSQATYDSFKSYFAGQGLTVSADDPFHFVLGLSGTRSQLDAAFATHSVFAAGASGATGFVNTSALRLPASLAAATTGVQGMNGLSVVRSNAVVNPADTSVSPSAQPNSNTIVCREDLNGNPVPPGPHVFCGKNDPTSFRKAYNVPDYATPLTTTMGGQGVKVGIVIWSAPDAPSIAYWNANYADGVTGSPNNLFPPLTYTIKGLAFVNANAYVETDLDLTAVHTMAPDASLTVYTGSGGNADGSASNAQVNVELLQAILDNNNVINNSYGSDCDTGGGSDTVITHQILTLAALKRETVVFSAGDSGVITCYDSAGAINGPIGYASTAAADPQVVAVGGTTLEQNNDFTWQGEVGWSCAITSGAHSVAPTSYTQCNRGAGNDSGGGGLSGYSGPTGARPFYQFGFIPNPASITTSIDGLYPPIYDINTPPFFTFIPSSPAIAPAPFDPALLAHAGTRRATPDISMEGDVATGLATPLIRGGAPGLGRVGGTSLAAPLVSGVMALAVQGNGGNIGLPNFYLYSHCASSPSWCYDVTKGFNGSYARIGWDYVTGLGSLKDVSAFLSSYLL